MLTAIAQFAHRVPILIKSARKMRLNATELLTHQHIELEALLMRARVLALFEKQVPKLHKTVELLSTRIHQHLLAEESVFYPECERLVDLAPLLKDSLSEHNQVRIILAELIQCLQRRDQSPESLPLVRSKLAELERAVSWHISEEEEDLFPLVQKQISRKRLEKLATQMRIQSKPARKLQLVA